METCNSFPRQTHRIRRHRHGPCRASMLSLKYRHRSSLLLQTLVSFLISRFLGCATAPPGVKGQTGKTRPRPQDANNNNCHYGEIRRRTRAAAVSEASGTRISRRNLRAENVRAVTAKPKPNSPEQAKIPTFAVQSRFDFFVPIFWRRRWLCTRDRDAARQMSW